MQKEPIDIYNKRLLKEDLSDISGSDNSYDKLDCKKNNFITSKHPDQFLQTDKIMGSRNSIISKNNASKNRSTAKKHISKYKQIKSCRPMSHFVENNKNPYFAGISSSKELQNETNSRSKNSTKNNQIYSSRQVSTSNGKNLPYGLENVMNVKRNRVHERNLHSNVPKSNFANRVNNNDYKMNSVDNKLDCSLSSFYFNNKKVLDDMSHSDHKMLDNQCFLNNDKVTGSFRINTESNLGLKDDRLSMKNSVRGQNGSFRGLNGSFNNGLLSKRGVPVNSTHQFDPYNINEEFWKISHNVMCALEDFICSRDKDDYFAIYNLEETEKHIKMVINEKIKLKNIIEYFDKFISKGRNALWMKRRLISKKHQGLNGAVYQDSAMSRNFRAVSSNNIVDNIFNYEMNSDPKKLYNLIDGNPQSKQAIEQILDGYCELNKIEHDMKEVDSPQDEYSLNSKACKASIPTDLIEKNLQMLQNSVNEIGSSNPDLCPKFNIADKDLTKTSRTINDTPMKKLEQINKDLSNKKQPKSDRSSIDRDYFCQANNEIKATMEQHSLDMIEKSKSLQRRNSSITDKKVKKRGKILEKISPTNSKPGILKYMYKEDDSQSLSDYSIKDYKKASARKSNHQEKDRSGSIDNISNTSPFRIVQVLKDSGSSIEKPQNYRRMYSQDKKKEFKIQVMLTNSSINKRTSVSEVNYNVKNSANTGYQQLSMNTNDASFRKTFPDPSHICNIQLRKASKDRRSQNKKAHGKNNHFAKDNVLAPRNKSLTVQQKSLAINSKNENIVSKFDQSLIQNNQDIKKKLNLTSESINGSNAKRIPIRKKQKSNDQNFNQQQNDLEYELNCLEMKSKILQHKPKI